MVDFSYKRPVLDGMFRKANSLLILDHHKTAAEDLAGYKSPFGPGWKRHLENVAQDDMENCQQPYALFDMERSGAAIAWDFFIGGERPEFIEYVQDRDLWRKSLPYGDEFSIALRSYPQDFAVWDRFVESTGAALLIQEGHNIQRYYRLRVEELKRHAYPARINQDRCWISNAPYFAASEVAGELCDQDGAAFGACYFEVEAGRFQYSLRSRGDFDVSAIARRYGGGGHKNAAGFSSNQTVHFRD